MNKFENNSGLGYYPDDLVFDEITQTYKKAVCDKKNNAEFDSKKAAQSNIFSENLLSKMFQGNDMISTFLKGGLLNGSSKNNIIMQALSNITKQKDEKKEKNDFSNDDDFFEEL